MDKPYFLLVDAVSSACSDQFWLFLRDDASACRGRCKCVCVCVSAGKREQSCEQVLEQPHAANQLPAARGGATAAQAVVVKPFSQAPPAPVPTPVQAVKPPLAHPAVSHNASVFCDRQRTIPNILSRSRKPCPTKNTQGKSAPRPSAQRWSLTHQQGCGIMVWLVFAAS